MLDKERLIVTVAIDGRSWASTAQGLYCFEATINGEARELHVSEDVAFDLLGAWTFSREKCLDILRLHRADLAKNLERKLRGVFHPGDKSHCLLTLPDIQRTHPAARDRQRAEQPHERTEV